MTKSVEDLKKEKENINVLGLYNSHNGWWHFLEKLPK